MENTKNAGIDQDNNWIDLSASAHLTLLGPLFTLRARPSLATTETLGRTAVDTFLEPGDQAVAQFNKDRGTEIPQLGTTLRAIFPARFQGEAPML